LAFVFLFVALVLGGGLSATPLCVTNRSLTFMKKILPLLIMFFVFEINNFAQSNLFFGNKNAFTISTSFEKVEGNNNIILVSPFYSIKGNYDFGLNVGYSLKEPNIFILNPLAFMHLFNDETHKMPFNIAYGLGYKYESTSIQIGNIKTEMTSNYFQLYYLMYYSMILENLIIQPQLNALVFLGESKITSNVTNINTSENAANTVANIKIGLAFIYDTDNLTIHFIPNVFLDNEGKTFSAQIGFTF